MTDAEYMEALAAIGLADCSQHRFVKFFGEVEWDNEKGPIRHPDYAKCAVCGERRVQDRVIRGGLLPSRLR
jgi:hypothetical protein